MAVTEQFLRNCRRLLNNKPFLPPHMTLKNGFMVQNEKKNPRKKKHEIGGMDVRTNGFWLSY